MPVCYNPGTTASDHNFRPQLQTSPYSIETSTYFSYKTFMLVYLIIYTTIVLYIQLSGVCV